MAPPEVIDLVPEHEDGCILRLFNHWRDAPMRQAAAAADGWVRCRPERSTAR